MDIARAPFLWRNLHINWKKCRVNPELKLSQIQNREPFWGIKNTVFLMAWANSAFLMLMWWSSWSFMWLRCCCGGVLRVLMSEMQIDAHFMHLLSLPSERFASSGAKVNKKGIFPISRLLWRNQSAAPFPIEGYDTFSVRMWCCRRIEKMSHQRRPFFVPLMSSWDQ